MTPHTDFRDDQPSLTERVGTRIGKTVTWRLVLLLLALAGAAWAGSKFLTDPDAELREAFFRLKDTVVVAYKDSLATATASENLAWDSVATSNNRVRGLLVRLGAVGPMRTRTITVIDTVEVPGPGEPADAPVRIALLDTLTGRVDTIATDRRVADRINTCNSLAAECALLSTRLDAALLAKAETDRLNEALRDSLTQATDVAEEIIEPSKVPLLGLPWRALKPRAAVTFTATYNVLKCSEETSTSVGIINDIPTTSTSTTKCPSRIAVGPGVGLVWLIHF